MYTKRKWIQHCMRYVRIEWIIFFLFFFSFHCSREIFCICLYIQIYQQKWIDKQVGGNTSSTTCKHRYIAGGDDDIDTEIIFMQVFISVLKHKILTVISIWVSYMEFLTLSTCTGHGLSAKWNGHKKTFRSWKMKENGRKRSQRRMMRLCPNIYQHICGWQLVEGAIRHNVFCIDVLVRQMQPAWIPKWN